MGVGLVNLVRVGVAIALTFVFALAVAAPGAATPPIEQSVADYAYDGHGPLALLEDKHPERGPPACIAGGASPDAVDHRSRGMSSRHGSGRTHARTRVLVLVQDLNIRIVDRTTGELLRELVLDETRRYQPTGRPPGPPRKTT